MERLLTEERERARSELEALRAAAQAASVADRTATVERSRTAAKSLELDEADTRKLIDEHLREAGWEAES